MTASKTIVLVVDDEKALRDFVRRNLEVRGFHAIPASDGLEALAIFNTEQVDLVILDLMMPHMNGLETLKKIREMSLVPVVVLSALGEETDKVKAFNLGADDYLTKPFGVQELLARVKAVLRRSQWVPQVQTETTERLVRGPLVAYPSEFKITMNDNNLDLTPTEFSLLYYLMQNAGKVLPHATILQHVWGSEYGQELEYLRVYMGRLRQKLEKDPTSPKLLRTARGVGYIFQS